jgi:hypothetical protein
MRRVTHANGTVAGYVWAFAEELSPSGPLRRGMRQCGIDLPPLPGAADSRLEALTALFGKAGFENIATRTIDVTLAYADFDDFWQAQTSSYSPTTKTIAAMNESERARLMQTVRAGLPVRADGAIAYSARANAVKARAPA